MIVFLGLLFAFIFGAVGSLVLLVAKRILTAGRRNG